MLWASRPFLGGRRMGRGSGPDLAASRGATSASVSTMRRARCVTGTLCDRHAEGHPHVNYGSLVPMVNSSRTGMCGYVGPADPPR